MNQSTMSKCSTNASILAVLLFLLPFPILSLNNEMQNSLRSKISERRKGADELGVPECRSNFDCVASGVCVKDRNGRGRCFCSSSCPYIVPLQCTENNHYSCVSMGDSYTVKYDMRNPLCYHKRCICPPQFDPPLMLPPASGFNTQLPMKCDKRDLQAVFSATPSTSVSLGSVAYLFCCVNLDPRTFIPNDGVVFVQNDTIQRHPTSTPYGSFSHDIDTYFSVPTCWVLGLNNVQHNDSGTYKCIVRPANARYRVVNATMEFIVKEPKTIKSNSITILPDKNSVTVTWEEESGSQLQIDMQLFAESVTRPTETKRGVKSPVIFDHLSPSTSYRLHVNITDGQNEPTKIIESFITLNEFPDPPILESIGVVDGSGGKFCEIKWRPSSSDASLDQIKRYFVQISGRIRYVPPESKMLPLDHYPESEDCLKAEQIGQHYINRDDSRMFFSCKYGPLKPNRNYSATVWAENSVGRSIAVSINRQCLMDFAEPEIIESPIIASRQNISSFGLRFEREPNQENGPIVCYYLAILPLPMNVSVEMLPKPTNVTMDTFDRALNNNQNQFSIRNKQFFAYIAESYLHYPRQTVVGDRETSAGVDACTVPYMTRYTPSDSALIPGLKYTGFLIARVDRDQNLHFSNHRHQGHSSASSPNRLGRHADFGPSPRLVRWRRQLTNSDPAYGFSGYFQPILLKFDVAGGISSLEIFLISFFVLTFLLLSTTIVVYFMHKRGIIKQLCCPSKKGSHALLKPGIPPGPIRSDDLPAEYILKHRDSDYQFAQEFEMLPLGKNLDHTISERKENARKNRYNDIKACDATRVRLRRVPGDPNSSDYINANFIKGYKGRKCFIATQGTLECTIGDFWRMIWEQGSRMIIMVTNLRERGREQCVKYWPDDEEPPLVFRTLEVAAVDSSYYADYTLRVFEMSDTDSEPPPQPARSNGRVNASGERSLYNNNTEYNIPFDESSRLAGNSPSPPLSFSLIQTSKADPMNSSAFSVHSKSSHDIHSTIQRRKYDSEYANIASIIRPQSKSSGRMSVMEGREKRRILQFHFTSWNDYKAPECTVALLKLLYRLRKLDEYNHFPVVVHCSAGVGRTGTLVAIDFVMDQMLDLGIADIYNCVAEMRQQRNLMVQSVEQYVFIYKALAEFQLFGDTDLTIAAFRRHFGRLRQPLQTLRERHLSLGGASSRSSSVQLSEENPRQRTISLSQREKEGVGAAMRTRLRLFREGNSNNGITTGQSVPMQNGGVTLGARVHRPKSQLELEFQDLFITLEKPKSTEWAHKEENALLNRSCDAVPFNFNRVVLHPMIDYENTYVNASLVKGYFYPYILAQDPLSPETVFDFWRMVNDQQSYTIVMLSTEEDFLPHEIYWPREISKRLIFGKNNELSITLAEEIVLSGFVQRKLHYRFKHSDKSIATSGRDVLQFAFLQWKSGAPTPNSPGALLDLIGRVLERQSNISNAGPIVLHCRDGSAENGLFSCVSLLLERLRSEQLIDVFRTVKALQLQRPLLFSKIEQYVFCYECVMEYLNTCK